MTNKEEESTVEDSGVYMSFGPSKLNLPEGIKIHRGELHQYGRKLPYSKYADFKTTGKEERLPPKGPGVSG